MRTLLALLISAFLLFGCAIPGQQQPKLLCEDGRQVYDYAECAPLPEFPPENVTNATPFEPEKPYYPSLPPAEPQKPAECGNGACSSNESFGTCPSDCAPTYRYLYEYDEGLTFAYSRCDRIGDRATCWTETTYVERAEPVYLPNSINTQYSVYNSFMLRIINGTAEEERPIKIWANNTSSECMRMVEPVPAVSVFYNASPSDKFYPCPKILSIAYLGDEDVNVPIGLFPKAQKFRITYLPQPDNALIGEETMIVWKAKAPLPTYIDYKFLAHGNVLVPVKTERKWSYINSQGLQVFVTSNSTLTKYIEPLYIGQGTSTGQSVG